MFIQYSHTAFIHFSGVYGGMYPNVVLSSRFASVLERGVAFLDSATQSKKTLQVLIKNEFKIRKATSSVSSTFSF